MLSHLPRAVPALSTLLDDLGNPSPVAIGRALDVSARTVQRWQALDEAPRAAALALFYVTRWGHSAVHCQAHNDAVMAQQLAALSERQNVALRVELARVLRLAQFDCANDVSQLAEIYLRAARALP
jgi:hypothetical protein